MSNTCWRRSTGSLAKYTSASASRASWAAVYRFFSSSIKIVSRFSFSASVKRAHRSAPAFSSADYGKPLGIASLMAMYFLINSMRVSSWTKFKLSDFRIVVKLSRLSLSKCIVLWLSSFSSLVQMSSKRSTMIYVQASIILVSKCSTASW